MERAVPAPTRHLHSDDRLLPRRHLSPLPRLAELHDLARYARQHRAIQCSPLNVRPHREGVYVPRTLLLPRVPVLLPLVLPPWLPLHRPLRFLLGLLDSSP